MTSPWGGNSGEEDPDREGMRKLTISIFWVFCIGLHLWSAGALYYCTFDNDALRAVAASAYVAVITLFVMLNPKKTRALVVTLTGVIAISAGFNSIEPKKDGVYPEELTMPRAAVSGDKVTFYNVRNCEYRAKDDFDVRYEDRTYDLSKLKTLDILVNFWGIDFAAHTFLSYGFSDGQYLTVSIEIRPEAGEGYGALTGLYKQYEIIYIWSDERDLIRKRTNYLGEDVYLYRADFTPGKVKRLFMDMIARTNSLYESPEFYNTAIESCTNTIGDHIVRTGIKELPFWKRRLLTGSVDRRLYNEGWLVTNGKPFPELRRSALINDRAITADRDSDFSKRIRTHLTKGGLQ
jgi:hypothetical protein